MNIFIGIIIGIIFFIVGGVLFFHHQDISNNEQQSYLYDWQPVVSLVSAETETLTLQEVHFFTNGKEIFRNVQKYHRDTWSDIVIGASVLYVKQKEVLPDEVRIVYKNNLTNVVYDKRFTIDKQSIVRIHNLMKKRWIQNAPQALLDRYQFHINFGLGESGTIRILFSGMDIMKDDVTSRYFSVVLQEENIQEVSPKQIEDRYIKNRTFTMPEERGALIGLSVTYVNGEFEDVYLAGKDLEEGLSQSLTYLENTQRGWVIPAYISSLWRNVEGVTYESRYQVDTDALHELLEEESDVIFVLGGMSQNNTIEKDKNVITLYAQTEEYIP